MSQDTTATIEIRFSFFPSAWKPGTARELFDTLVGADRLYPATAWGNEGDESLPADDGELIYLLTERYESSSWANRITLFTDRPFVEYSFNLHRTEWHNESGFGQLLFWPKNLWMRVPVDQFDAAAFDAIVHVAHITEAPLVELDYVVGTEESITIAARRELRRVVQGTLHAKATAGPYRGLHRIPWRLILGTDMVNTIGADRLAAVGSEHAVDHGNTLWTLQTTADPVDSVTDAGREAERSLIAAIGPQFFCDTDANKLADAPPQFPEALRPADHSLFERYGERLKSL